MSTALKSALESVAYGRLKRIKSVAADLQIRDSAQTFAVGYAGYSNGSHLGKLPNGGIIPLGSASNGAIAQGEIVTANQVGAGQTISSWMPQ